MFTNIGEIRRKNLLDLGLSSSELAHLCGGQAKTWANVRSSAGKKGRPFGEKKARLVEVSLGLEAGQLDLPPGGLPLTVTKRVMDLAKQNPPPSVGRNTARGILTQLQFDAIAQLLSHNAALRSAAELVLVHGWPIIDAARKLGTSNAVLGRAVRRFQEAHVSLFLAYKRSK